MEEVLKTTPGGASILKEMSVYPQPLQSPYPQGWAASGSPRSVAFAAERGLNAFFTLGGPEQIKKDMDFYYSTAEKAGWPDRLGRGQFKYGWDSERRRGLAHLRAVHIHDSDVGNGAAYKLGLEHFGSYFLSNVVGSSGLLPKDITAEKVTPISIDGSRDQVIEQLLELALLSGDNDFLFLLWFDVPGLTDEEHEEQLRVFGEDIMPALERELGGAAPRIVDGRAAANGAI